MADAAKQSQDATGEWKYLSDQEARQHRYFGVSGWLILFLVNVLLIVVVGVSQLVDVMRLPHAVGPYTMVSSLIIVSRILMGLWALYAAVRLRALFVKAAVAIVLVSAVSVLIDVIYLVLSGNFHALKDQIVAMLLAEAIFVAWFLYFRYSERVNVTYLKRVRLQNVETVD